MSAHLDGYMNALKQSKKLNKEAETFSDLMIGARRGAGSSQPGRGRAFPIPRSGRLQGMGANNSQDPSCRFPGQNDLPLGAPVGGPCPEEFLCDCDLIGATTLGTAPVVPGTAGGSSLLITNFDAVALQAVAIWFTAFEAAPAPDANNLIANPVIELPTVVTNVTIGGNSQLRARGIGNGLNSAAFAATREPVCVDWAPFRSQNGQELQIFFDNIVVTSNIHFFVVLWCNVLA